MESNKPTSLEEYRTWLGQEHGLDRLARHENHYGLVALKVAKDFEASQVWTELIQKSRDIGNEYLLNSGYQLFAQPESLPPEILRKSFKSFLEKTFRRNVLANPNWPDPPNGGWLLPPNWFSQINDIVRTLFVVKYLDGVEFLVTSIQSLCNAHSVECEVEFQAREEGYYAAHINIIQDYEIPALNFDTSWSRVAVEVQITTQVQDLIRTLLHKHYEDRRMRLYPDDVKWQWDYACKEFSTNYLGHILHYVEGMIMEIREQSNG